MWNDYYDLVGDPMITSSSTATNGPECKHNIGWYKYIEFKSFLLTWKRKYLVCEMCFEIVPQEKWKLDGFTY